MNNNLIEIELFKLSNYILVNKLFFIIKVTWIQFGCYLKG